MPQGDKSSYSSKQRRQAGHIENGYKKDGASSKRAESIAWATVNKQDGGAKGAKAGRSAAGSSSKKRAIKSSSRSAKGRGRS